MRRWWIAIGLAPVLFLAWGFAGALESSSEGRPQLVHDFFPGEFETDFTPGQPTRLGNVLFFAAQDLDRPFKVWRTDGTPGGTRPLRAAGFPEAADDFQWILGSVGRYLLWYRDLWREVQ